MTDAKLKYVIGDLVTINHGDSNLYGVIVASTCSKYKGTHLPAYKVSFFSEDELEERWLHPADFLTTPSNYS